MSHVAAEGAGRKTETRQAKNGNGNVRRQAKYGNMLRATRFASLHLTSCDLLCGPVPGKMHSRQAAAEGAKRQTKHASPYGDTMQYHDSLCTCRLALRGASRYQSTNRLAARLTMLRITCKHDCVYGAIPTKMHCAFTNQFRPFDCRRHHPANSTNCFATRLANMIAFTIRPVRPVRPIRHLPFAAWRFAVLRIDCRRHPAQPGRQSAILRNSSPVAWRFAVTIGMAIAIAGRCRRYSTRTTPIERGRATNHKVLIIIWRSWRSWRSWRLPRGWIRREQKENGQVLQNYHTCLP